MQRSLGVCLLLLAAGGVSRADGWGTALFPSGASFRLEVASDPATRQRGYMFRERVGPREGMLFVFDRSGRHGIWMKNCVVALDLVWLDERHEVVEMVENRQPCPASGPCPTAVPLRQARYVLEVAAGTVAEQGLRLGDRLQVVIDADRR